MIECTSFARRKQQPEKEAEHATVQKTGGTLFVRAGTHRYICALLPLLPVQ